MGGNDTILYSDFHIETSISCLEPLFFMKSAIVIDKLCKNYNGFPALKNLSFQVKKGECIGLLGPNGAGKTTTIQILTGLLEASSGEVHILGISPGENPKAVHHFIAQVPDRQAVYEDLTVEQNIEVFRQIYKEPKEKTRQIIEKVELTDKSKTKAKKLSRGLKQRLLIARTLVHTPELIFLDEPTSGLDPSSTDFICGILESLKQNGVTMILSTHLMSLAERLCDNIVLLDKGEKREEGQVLEIKRKYGSSKIKIQFLENGKSSSMFIPFTDTFIKELLEIQKTKKILSINTFEPSLEDIFIRIVRDKK